MDTLTLSPDVLEWAARRAGESLEGLAQTLCARESDRQRIVAGEITVAQAEKIAARANVPFGLLFVESPLEIRPRTIPDLRQAANPPELSREFFDVLADVSARQAWYIEALKRGGSDRLPFVGKFQYRPTLSPILVAADIRGTLDLSDADREDSPTSDVYFGRIAEKAERAGILVMKSGIVRSNTRRPLSEREFRGLALPDPFAPLIFVNGRDADVASVFTLGHELAHIWLGQYAVSDVVAPRARAGLERFSNEVAAELLLPKDVFLERWRARAREVEKVARDFRVSRLVVAIRALGLRLVSQTEVDAIAAKTIPVVKKKDSGGNPYATIPVRNSKRLTRALVASALRGETLIREASSLLNVKPDTVMKLGKKLFDDRG